MAMLCLYKHLLPGFIHAVSFLASVLRHSSTLTQRESLSIRPRYCPQCSEFVGGCPDRRRSLEGDQANLKEVYKAGNLAVFAGERQRPDQPVQLDFHFAHGSQGVSHWHGLLQARTVFLDTPRLALDCNSRESLTATLEYVEENTEADQVLVNFHKSRRDRGDLLRAFGFLGFKLMRPDHPSLPPWEDVIFMAYPMERDLCQAEENEKWRTLKPDMLGRQDGGCSWQTGSLNEQVTDSPREWH
ncbi:LOW QUALITY PROTEIN: ornithine decarboxylase antizyme 3 [Lacerta agilis]|uniref:LOW QUALITY PROTEIN: ornithine decarboxylase antizyme 3 n=1 Tax=Lacerta agilis TaxID=80427 RepID=UPI00141A1606|nr:LOW QUALITY PROTEIN: ornithine decarboxylase antizyme 3 [Lacerta agilis]